MKYSDKMDHLIWRWKHSADCYFRYKEIRDSSKSERIRKLAQERMDKIREEYGQRCRQAFDE